MTLLHEMSVHTKYRGRLEHAIGLDYDLSNVEELSDLLLELNEQRFENPESASMKSFNEEYSKMEMGFSNWLFRKTSDIEVEFYSNAKKNEDLGSIVDEFKLVKDSPFNKYKIPLLERYCEYLGKVESIEERFEAGKNVKELIEEAKSLFDKNWKNSFKYLFDCRGLMVMMEKKLDKEVEFIQPIEDSNEGTYFNFLKEVNSLDPNPQYKYLILGLQRHTGDWWNTFINLNRNLKDLGDPSTNEDRYFLDKFLGIAEKSLKDGYVSDAFKNHSRYNPVLDSIETLRGKLGYQMPMAS